MSRFIKSLFLGAVVFSLAPLAFAGTIVTTFSNPLSSLPENVEA